MELGLKGKLALVTGASRGIGRAVAAGLANEGVRVVIAARGEDRLRKAAEELGAAGAISADLRSAEEIDRLAATLRADYGEPAILVTNAGGPPPGQAQEASDEDWALGHDLTLMPAVRLSRDVLPAMRRQRWGRIVNITSLSVKEPVPNLVLSNAFRAAVTGFARTLATEVAAEGVTVNNVAPGATDTDRLRELHGGEDALGRVAASIPTGRLATPEEVAAAAVFLCGKPAAMMTGQTLLVDGGAVGTLW